MLLSKIFSLFYDGYTYGMLMLILCYYFFKKYRSNILTFIGIANSWLAIYGITTFCIYFKEIFIGWYSQNPYEGYTFQYSRANILGPFGLFFLGKLILILLILIIFCFKKNRKKIWLSILAIFVIHFLYLSELFIIYSSVYRDYLPSSFSSYYHFSIFRDVILGILFFTFLIGITYLITGKIKKLKIRI